MAVSRRFSSPVLCAALSLVFISGCGEDESTPCDPTNTGRIQGTILAAGEPVIAHIDARQVGRLEGRLSYYHTSTDSSGAYSLSVSPGDYLLRIDGFQCASFYNHGTLRPDKPETLHVARGASVTASLRAGAFRVDLATPAELEGEHVLLRLQSTADCYTWGDAVTAAGGSVLLRIPNVLPGTYRMLVTVPDHGEIWLPGTTDFADADSVVIVAGEEKLYQASLPPAAILRGSLTGSWQELGYLPGLALADPDLGRPIAFATVDPVDGSYELQVYGRIHGVLNIQIGGTTRWYGGTSPETATRIDIEPGEVVELNLRESGVAGWMNRPAPQNGTELSLWDSQGTLRGRAWADGPRGFFRIANLETGTYFLKIQAGPTWIEQWHDKADSLAAATPIVVTEEGSVVWLDLDLEDGGRVEGRLLRANGSPAYGLPVQLWRRSEVQAIRNVTSNDEGGGFALLALPDGDYRLVAFPIAFGPPVFYPGVMDSAQAEILSIRDHAAITGLVFQLP